MKFIINIITVSFLAATAAAVFVEEENNGMKHYQNVKGEIRRRNLYKDGNDDKGSKYNSRKLSADRKLILGWNDDSSISSFDGLCETTFYEDDCEYAQGCETLCRLAYKACEDDYDEGDEVCSDGHVCFALTWTARQCFDNIVSSDDYDYDYGTGGKYSKGTTGY